jgi:hypothetical protein
LLGEVMKILLRYQTIPKDLLQGSLSYQALPLPTTALQSGRLQSLGEFWQAMGGKPRAALHYTVTVGVPLEKVPSDAQPAMTDVVTDYRIEIDMQSKK